MEKQLPCPKCGKPQYHNIKGEKSRTTSIILAFLFGWLSIHWFYLGHGGKGILYLFTFGLLGIGTLVDFISFLMMSESQFNKQYN